MMRIYLRLLRQFWRLNIARETQYRANFFALAGVGVIEAVLTVLPMLLLFSFTTSLSGWNAGESLALVGLFRVAIGLYMLIAGNGITMLSQDIEQGNLDYLLIRPVNAQFLVTFRFVSLPQLVNVLIGVVIVSIGLSRAELVLTPGGVMIALVVYVSGLVLLTAAISAGSYLAFGATTVDGLPWMLYDIASMGQYPIRFYPVGVRVFLTGVMPVAFVSTIPIDALRGEHAWWIAALAVLFAIAAVKAVRWWWQHSVGQYASASS